MLLLKWRFPSRSRLQLRVTLMLVTAVMALIGADAVGIWSTRQETIAAAQAGTTNLAESLANDVAGVFRTMDTILVGLRERVVNDGTGPAALERLAHVLRERAAMLPMIHSLIVLDSQGHLLVSADGLPRIAMDMSASATFAHHRDDPDLGVYISPPVRSVLDGKWVIKMSRRVNRPGGDFGGVVIGCVAVGYFEAFFGSFDVGKEGAILLATRQGFAVARSPPAPGYVGRKIAQADRFKTATRAKSQLAFEATSPIDDTRRLVSFHEVPGTADLVLVGRSKYEVLSGWRKTAALHGLGLSVLISLIVFLARRLAAGIRENEHSAGLLRKTIEKLRHSEQELLLARDASEASNKALAVLNQTLETMALHDGLTGLANRRHFDMSLALEFGRARRSWTSLALILIDVDHFKRFNDLYGHPAGDACLRRIGEALLSFTKRSGEIACRYGGEEMAILLPGVDADQAVDTAERIAQAVRDLEIAHAGSPAGRVTISVGVTALAVLHTSDAAALVAQADLALYAAKADGRDRVLAYSAAGNLADAHQTHDTLLTDCVETRPAATLTSCGAGF